MILTKKPEIEIAVTKEEILIYRELEEKVKKILGTKVSISKKQKNKGKIEIEYYSDEELERIMELFEKLG
jgi:ParB family chromosome partitioning protein